jgi:hypothetical protein
MAYHAGVRTFAIYESESSVDAMGAFFLLSYCSMVDMEDLGRLVGLGGLVEVWPLEVLRPVPILSECCSFSFSSSSVSVCKHFIPSSSIAALHFHPRHRHHLCTFLTDAHVI